MNKWRTRKEGNQAFKKGDKQGSMRLNTTSSEHSKRRASWTQREAKTFKNQRHHQANSKTNACSEHSKRRASLAQRHASSSARQFEKIEKKKRMQRKQRLSARHALLKQCHAIRREPCKNHSYQQKKMRPRGIELCTTGLTPRCTSRLSWGTSHPQPYLTGVDMENFTLINHFLICAIMS